MKKLKFRFVIICVLLISGFISATNLSIVEKDFIEVRLFPAEFGRANVLPLVRNTPSFARFAFLGKSGGIQDDVTLIINVPIGTGTYDLYGEGKEVNIDGANYIQFHIPVNPSIIRQMLPVSSHAAINVWFNTSKMPKDGNIIYYLEVAGKSLTKKKAIIKVLPELLEGKLPEKFIGFFNWDTFKDVPKKLFASVYEMLRKMGVNAHYRRKNTDWGKYISKRLAEEGGTLWGNIRYSKGTPPLDGVYYDWEPQGPLNNPMYEDKKLREEFAKFNSIDLEKITTERLKGELNKKWIFFRSWKLAKHIREWANKIHAEAPDVMLGVAQGSGYPVGSHIDYKAYDVNNIIHMPMIYTSDRLGYATRIKETKRYLPNSEILPFISSSMVLDKGWFAASQPKTIYSHILSSAFQGCIGVAYWPDLERGFDMGYVWEIVKATQEIGSVEKFLFEGNVIKHGALVKGLYENEEYVKVGKTEVHVFAPQWDKYSICGGYSLGKDKMFYFNNFHTEKLATVSVTIEDAEGNKWYAYNPITKKLLVQDDKETWTAKELKKGLAFEVEPENMGILVVSKNPPTNISEKEIRVSEVLLAFNKRSEKAKATTNLASMKKGNLEINWADMDGDGNAEIRLANSKQELGFGNSGNLWSWKVGKKKKDFISRFNGNGAFSDKFWYPKGARSSKDGRSPYELVSRKIENGVASVIFRRKLTHNKLNGMIIEKEYLIKEDVTKVELKITIKNNTPDNHKISYWSHNCFSAGKTPFIILETEKGEVIIDDSLKEKDRRFIRSDLTDAELELLLPRGERPEDVLKKFEKHKKIRFTNSKIILGKSDTPHLIINTNHDEMLQILRWWDKTKRGRYTLEWMYKVQEIKSGHSWTTIIKVEAKE